MVLTLPNFVDFLSHIIFFQAWRPDVDGHSYMLVGSNRPRFSGLRLRRNITEIPDKSTEAFFSFYETIPEEEWINVLPGDVMGWFILPTATIFKPLSPLFRDPIPTDPDNIVVDMFFINTTDKEMCIICNFIESATVIASIVPLVSATVSSQNSTTSK